MSQISNNEGSYGEWNAIWKTYQENSKEENFAADLLYTNETPKTILEFWQKCYFEDLIKLTKNKNYKSFLELGSGRGTTSMYLAANGATDITMVDLSEEAFRLASINFSAVGLALPKMILANVENTSLSPNSYDCIYNIGLLEHFENPEPTIRESFRLLKSKGMIFMPIVPSLPFYKSLFARLFFSPLSIPKYLIWKAFFGRKRNNAMIRTEIKKAEYIKMAKNAGFENVICTAYNPYWKINKSKWFEKNITLFFYKKHYNFLKSKNNNSPTLKTANLFEQCYLLIAYKK